MYLRATFFRVRGSRVTSPSGRRVFPRSQHPTFCADSYGRTGSGALLPTSLTTCEGCSAGASRKTSPDAGRASRKYGGNSRPRFRAKAYSTGSAKDGKPLRRHSRSIVEDLRQRNLQQAHLRFRGIRQRAVVNAKQLVGNQCLFWLVDTAASGLLPQTKREQRVSSSYRDVLLAAH
jgi:hypothetical protein